jgi:hypothetical protein
MDDVIARLAATPGALAHLLVDVAEERLDMAFSGDWSTRTILAHLRDGESLSMRLNLERILAEDTPAIRFLDPGTWEPGRNRSRDRKEWLLADFALQRQASLALLRALRPSDLARRARLADGEITLRDLAAEWIRRDAKHIARLEAAIGETLADALARRTRPE